MLACKPDGMHVTAIAGNDMQLAHVVYYVADDYRSLGIQICLRWHSLILVYMLGPHTDPNHALWLMPSTSCIFTLDSCWLA